MVRKDGLEQCSQFWKKTHMFRTPPANTRYIIGRHSYEC